MLIPPESVTATWPEPDYVNPVTQGDAGKIIGIVLTATVTVILVIRFYTRQFISNSIGLDDVLIAIAYFPALAFSITSIRAETVLGWNRHLWDVEYDVIGPGLKMSLVTYVLFDLGSNLTKLSMLAMLYRLLGPGRSGMKIGVFVAGGFVISSSVVFVFVVIFQCSPVSDYWTLSIDPQNCIDEGAHLLAAGIINTLTDFIVVILPVQTMLGLQLPRKQHLILIGLFCAGFGACLAGVVRTYYTWHLTRSWDRTWMGYPVWVSSIVELYVGIICASVPPIKQFFTLYLPGVIDSTRRGGRASSHTSNNSITHDREKRRSAGGSYGDDSSHESHAMHRYNGSLVSGGGCGIGLGVGVSGGGIIGGGGRDGGHNGSNRKLTVTVNTTVETRYERRSSTELLMDELTSSTVSAGDAPHPPPFEDMATVLYDRAAPTTAAAAPMPSPRIPEHPPAAVQQQGVVVVGGGVAASRCSCSDKRSSSTLTADEEAVRAHQSW